MTMKIVIAGGIFLTLACAVKTCRAQSAEVSSPTQSPRYERQEFKAQDGTQLSFWLMKPGSLTEGKKYPLVLALHGRGGNSAAAAELAGSELRKEYPCFVMAPAVTRQQVWAVPGGFRQLPGQQMLTVVLEALEKVKADYPIDADRVYVTGQSMGGFGSFGAIAVSPETFAAAIPICGGWDPKDAAKMKTVPIWVFHGDMDTTVPVERSRTMVEAIKAAGGSPRYTEYPGVGHNSWSKTYASADTWKWLFSQRRQSNRNADQ